MRYLITTKDNFQPFLTKWFEPENFTPGMVVYDLAEKTYTIDGENWLEVDIDYL
jgi:hypothetical protein